MRPQRHRWVEPKEVRRRALNELSACIVGFSESRHLSPGAYVGGNVWALSTSMRSHDTLHVCSPHVNAKKIHASQTTLR